MTNNKRFRIPRFYKTLLALTVVIGPITWLMLTDDGRRRTDLMVLSLKGDHMVEMRLDTLASVFGEDKIREFLPDIQWQCSNNRTPLGERNCTSPIGAFNEAPAHYLVMYFEGNTLQAMKLVYRSDYHQYLGSMLTGMLGKAQEGDGVTQWSTQHGIVLLQSRLPEGTVEPSMMWLSAERALKQSTDPAN